MIRRDDPAAQADKATGPRNYDSSRIQHRTDPAILVGPSAEVLAKAGDMVRVGGGETVLPHVWNACAGVTVIQPG